jgi:hypothetical protein
MLVGRKPGQRPVEVDGKHLGQVGGGPECVTDELDPVARRVRCPWMISRVRREPTSRASARTARVATPAVPPMAIRTRGWLGTRGPTVKASESSAVRADGWSTSREAEGIEAYDALIGRASAGDFRRQRRRAKARPDQGEPAGDRRHHHHLRC